MMSNQAEIITSKTAGRVMAAWNVRNCLVQTIMRPQRPPKGTTGFTTQIRQRKIATASLRHTYFS